MHIENNRSGTTRPGRLTMDISRLEAEVRQLLSRHSRAADSDTSSLDTAWLVLEAANDLGDELAIAACRRVIDAEMNGRSALMSDLHIIRDYFR